MMERGIPTYTSHLTDTLKKLFSLQHYSDVTLLSDDNQQVHAHKLILSASSPVLNAMLTTNPHPHTLLYMRGIKIQELHAIVEFMYLGMTQVANSRIVEFMRIAGELGITDLASHIDNKASLIDHYINTSIPNINMQEELSIDFVQQKSQHIKEEVIKKGSFI